MRLGKVGVLILILTPGLTRAELSCPRPSVAVDAVRGGLPLARTFHLRNVGKTNIEVVDVHPSCGCLKPRLDRRFYQPDDEGALELAINTLTQPAGIHAWSVTVKYREDGHDRELMLSVTGTVVPELLLQPAALILNTDSTCTHDLTLTEQRAKPLTLQSIEATRPELRVMAEEVRKNADGTWSRTIHVTVNADLPPGHYDEMVQLLTNDQEFHELKFPVTVIKRSRQQVQATPAAVMLSGRPGETLPARIVLLESEGDQPVVVQRVEVGHGCIRCTAAAGPGQRSTLRIQVKGSELDKDLQSEVRVFLQGMEAPVRIPVQVIRGE